MSLYDAFKTLTTERSHNLGTIEIVKQSGSDVSPGRDAKITGLKCANHHFTRTSLNDANGLTHTTPQDLRATLQTAIEAELAGALSKLKSSNLTRFDDGQAEIKANFQKLKDACLSPLYEGKNLKNSEFTRVEIGQIITNVEKIKQNLNIEQLLNANTISSDDMETLKDVARFALGSGRGEGSLGGRGFMGITEDGKIVKFLTHRGESMDGVSQEGKQLATEASDRLRDKLAGIAEKLSQQQQGKVMEILDQGRGSEPLSRQDVARVLTLIGGSALDEKGNLFNWGDIKHAGTVKDTSLGAVFGAKSAAEETNEIKKAIKFNDNLKMPTNAELKSIYDRNKTNRPFKAMAYKMGPALANDLKRLEFDPKARAEALKGYEKINLQTLNDIKDQIEDVQDTTKATSKETFGDFFEIMEGGTASVAQQIVQKNGQGNVKLSAQIFADNTDFLCGIDAGWSTQEEALAYASNNESFKSIIAAGKVKLRYKEVQQNNKVTHQWRWEYDPENQPGSLDAVDSYAFKGQLNRDGATLQSLKKPIDLDWQFGAMPSFDLKESRDPRGNLAYLCKCRGLSNSPLTPQLRNAQKFIETLIAKQDSLSGTQKKEALKLLMFSGENDEFNVFGNNPEEEVDKLVKLVQSGKHKLGENSLLDQAQKNYKSTLLKVVSNWVALARERGTTHFIGGAAGLGAFDGDLDVVADVYAEAFAKHGGGMKFVYAAFNKQDDFQKIVKFQERFEARFNEVRATEPKKETAPANSAAPAESVGRSTANVGAQPVLDFHKDMHLKHKDLANMASRAIKDIAQGNGTLDEKSEKMEKYLTKLHMDLFPAGGGARASQITGLLDGNKAQIKALAQKLAEWKEEKEWKNTIGKLLQDHLNAVAGAWGGIVGLSLGSLHGDQEQLAHERGFSLGLFLFQMELVEALKA